MEVSIWILLALWILYCGLYVFSKSIKRPVYDPSDDTIHFVEDEEDDNTGVLIKKTVLILCR
jgi:hypothetical protein